jgi:hypothetical protein
MTAPIETDRARELAKRWAKWRTCADRLGAFSVMARSYKLTGPKRVALDAWVQARMLAEVERRRGIRVSTCRYRGFEGMDPPTGPVWDGLADDDREALAHAVMLDLGLEGPAGEHGTAWTLCERAGWPS